MNYEEMRESEINICDVILGKDTREYAKNLFKNKNVQEVLKVDKKLEWDQIMRNLGIAKNDSDDEVLEDAKSGFETALFEARNLRLKELGDINFYTTFNDFIELMQKNDFKIAWQNVYHNGRSDEHEQEVIMYDEKYGLLVYANTFDHRLNQATIIGEVAVDYKYKKGDERRYPLIKELAKEYEQHPELHEYYKTKEEFLRQGVLTHNEVFHKVPLSGSHERERIHFNVDLRPGTLDWVKQIRNQPFLKLLPQWEMTDRRRLTSILTTEELEDDYKPEKGINNLSEVINSKLQKCPEVIRKIINHTEKMDEIEGSDEQEME